MFSEILFETVKIHQKVSNSLRIELEPVLWFGEFVIKMCDIFFEKVIFIVDKL